MRSFLWAWVVVALGRKSLLLEVAVLLGLVVEGREGKVVGGHLENDLGLFVVHRCNLEVQNVPNDGMFADEQSRLLVQHEPCVAHVEAAVDAERLEVPAKMRIKATYLIKACR